MEALFDESGEINASFKTAHREADIAPATRAARAEELKSQGNAAFRRSDYCGAARMYALALLVLEGDCAADELPPGELSCG